MAKRHVPYQLAKFHLPAHRDYVVAEVKYEMPVGVDRGRFVGKERGEEPAKGLNDIISKFDVRDVSFHFRLKPNVVRECLALAATLREAAKAASILRKIKAAPGAKLDAPRFFQSNFVQVVPKRGEDAKKLAAALRGHPAIWGAHVAPLPVPPLYLQPPAVAAASSSNLEPTQGYLYSPPCGIGAMDVWKAADATGKGVTICDIEGGWNLTHEDLPKGIKVIGGTPLSEPDWVDHGTAVLGEMVSLPNAFGTVGISHGAKAVVQSAFVDDLYNPAAAIDNAATKLAAGDVILIELHSELHKDQGDYVAMQYYAQIFTAIRTAVEKGIVVVEAAGNGNQDFNAPDFADTGLQKDCGAIVVGAGVPPTNCVDFNGFGPGLPAYGSLGVPRSRIFFSNYGNIVNLQGWGWHVTTTGYGDAQAVGPNRRYTLRFSGTSSASPIVTGAVACLQEVARRKRGQPLTPAEMRRILIRTGTPQENGPGVPAATNQIGPQPNLAAAIGAV